MSCRLFILCCALLTSFSQAQSPFEKKFDFSSPRSGYTHVAPGDLYSDGTGFGFLNNEKPALFSVKVPEGNYNVTIVLGDRKEASDTTIKAECRQLIFEKVVTTPGQFQTRTFTTNIRTPSLSGGGSVGISKREQGPPLAARWDDRLTLEFNGAHPAVASVEIAAAPETLTVFLAGDSTVTDQQNEPWAGWGQMLPNFFDSGVAIANHAESGLALYSFKGQRRLQKILETIKKGDYLLIQFGHNDQKDKTPGAGPFTTYKDNLKSYVVAVREKGGLPVLVTPMERRRWANGQPQPTLADYAEAVRQVAAEEKVPVIDLNAMSLKFYAALGSENSTKAFVHYPANTFPGQDKPLKDDTHHNAYGGYELARCIVEGIKLNVPALAAHLRKDIGSFDPSQPDLPEDFHLPASPFAVIEKPAGS